MSNSVEDGSIIDDHVPIPELQAALAEAMKQVAAFCEAAARADEHDYEAAMILVKDSRLPEETKRRLVGALKTGEWDLIDSVFSDYKGRLGHAFCESCWR
jgi:hypothetical protein